MWHFRLDFGSGTLYICFVMLELEPALSCRQQSMVVCLAAGSDFQITAAMAVEEQFDL